MPHPLIHAAEASSLKASDAAPTCRVGDTVDVFYRIVEGKKERVQRFSGDVIALNGRGPTASFTVRRLVAGEGVERIFPVHSPNVERVEVKRNGQVRRAKLYYLRDRVGKATRIAEKKANLPVPKKTKRATAAKSGAK